MNRITLTISIVCSFVASEIYAQPITTVGFDTYGYKYGVTNAYWQRELAGERAIRVAVYSSDVGSGVYGFYRFNIAPHAWVSETKLYLEAGGGYASETVAVAANVGLTMPVIGLFLEPHLGVVAGGNGSGYGFGLNIGYRF